MDEKRSSYIYDYSLYNKNDTTILLDNRISCAIHNLAPKYVRSVVRVNSRPNLSEEFDFELDDDEPGEIIEFADTLSDEIPF